MTLYDSGVPYQRLIGVSGNIQRYRMMRYMLVLGIILVTIFLYVSYYTTPMSSVDNRYVAYVSQEQRLPPSQGSNGDQNFFSIPAEGNSSGGGVGVAKDTPPQPSQLEESSGPSEETKKSGDSSSSSSNISKGNDGDSAKAETGAGVPEAAAPKEQSNRQVNQANANLTAGKKPRDPSMACQSEVTGLFFYFAGLDQRAKANTSIVIPKVEIPPKQEVLTKCKRLRGI